MFIAVQMPHGLRLATGQGEVYLPSEFRLDAESEMASVSWL